MKFLLLLVAGIPILGWAFPDMIRHGYVNCMSCHVSPQGGGALTVYGRHLSKEVLSTWSAANEHHLFQGQLDPEKLPKWVGVLGADFRGLQLHRENSQVRSGRWIWMQADVEAGIQYRALRAQASAGPVRVEGGGRFDFKRYSVGAQVSPQHQWRVGKIAPAFGLNIAEHTSFVKQDLGLGAGLASPRLEVAWIGEAWNYLASVDLRTALGLSRAQSPVTQKFTQQVSYNFANRYKFSLNALLGPTQVYGASALLGWTPRLYTLAEQDFLLESGGRRGRAHYLKTGYELFRGFHFQATQEGFMADLQNPLTQKTSWGAGLVWYPRPHWELQLVWQKAQIKSFGNEWSNLAWFLLHYYL